MDSSDIQVYITEVARYPVLSKEAQLRHAYRIAAWVNHPEGRENSPRQVIRRGKHSMDLMIRTNLRLVICIAKNYCNRGLDLCDLIQEGNLGLIRGLELFDPTRGYAISTYSYWWIRQSITRAIYTHGRHIRVPINSYEVLNRAQRKGCEYMSTHGQAPSMPELSVLTDISIERLEMVLNTYAVTKCNSLDSPVRCTDGDTTYKDIVENTPNTDDDDGLSAWLSTILCSLPEGGLFNEVLEGLDNREIYIIRSVFRDGIPVRDLAKELLISGSRVRQIQSIALQKLRAHLTPEDEP